MSKDLFYFSKSDRIATIVLLAVIVVSTIVRTSFRSSGNNESDVPADSLEWIPQTVIAENIDTVPVRKARGSNVRSDYNYNKRVYSRDTVRKVSNAKIFSVNTDTVRKTRYQAKTAPQSPLDLNRADSSALVSLPGIGPYYASKIIRYREQLGGYVRINQILEVEGVPDSLMKWFFLADSVPFRKIQVNTESVSSLRKHPYLDFYQARAIVEFRRERGNIKGPEQLSFLEEFTDQDLVRLDPYLDYR